MSPPPPSPPVISQRTLAWEDRTAWPMFALSLVFFAAWVWLLADPTLTAGWTGVLVAVVALSWLVFIADFVIRLAISGARRLFLRTRWFEGVSLVIAYLRPFVIIGYLWRLPWFRATPGRQRARMVLLVVLFAFLFVFTASTLVWLAERGDPAASIVSLGDAIWWGFSTIATVGYGDFVPVTIPGRVIAVGLMMGGLVVLGVTSATVISALTEQVHRTGDRMVRERDAAAQVAHDAQRHRPGGAPTRPADAPMMASPPD